MTAEPNPPQAPEGDTEHESENEEILHPEPQETKETKDAKKPKQIPSIPWSEVNFTFPAPHVHFGKNVVEEIPKAIFYLLDMQKKAQSDRPKVMIIYGGASLKASGALDRILHACEMNAIDTLLYSCGSGEATTTGVNEGVQIAIENNPHYIVGIGGGSVLDVAKSIAGIVTNGAGLVEEYHEGKPFVKPGIPFIAVPTTAGTGSEITNNAVLIDTTKEIKKSIRGNQLIAKYILLDPELTLSCPPEITAVSGVDALVQAIEAYTSNKSHPLADIYAVEAIVLISRNLRKVFDDGNDFDARSEMMIGAFYAGVAFSNVGLGLVHGLAHPIGYRYKIPHGKVCGSLLPCVINYNLEYQPVKYAHVARILNKLDLFTKYEPTASDLENARRLPAMIKEILAQIQIPLRLQDLGVQKEDFEWIIANTKGGSVNSNARLPDPDSLRDLLENAW
jgi:alcohol dehydrogenase class IV